MRGVVTRGEAQIVFVDTPGLFAPKRRLDRAMVASAWGAAGDADVLALLIDAKKEAAHAGVSEETQAILDALKESRKPKLLVLNKIDAMERGKLLELSARLNAAHRFDETFMISAETGDGLDRLLDRLDRDDAAGAVALSGGPDHRGADPLARRRDHPRKTVRAAARRIALSGDGRDRQLEGLSPTARRGSSRRCSSPARATARS